MGILYIVATPIGNLGDISYRAVEILKGADLILCEDTRTTIKLLNRYEIKKPLISYHQHSKDLKVDQIINSLREGKKIALVSDAGSPGISDPGNKLIEQIVERDNTTEIISIPGPSALIALASVSGFPTDKFLFLGFPPQKNKRAKFFQEVADSQHPVIFYESPHRIIKALTELEALSGDFDVVVGRELTKKFETVYRGQIGKVKEDIEKKGPLGEFVVIVKKRKVDK